MAEGNGGVSFTVKEMLTNLDAKIDRIDEKLDHKVDRGEFNRIYGSVNDLTSKLGALESQVRTQDKINAALAQQTKETAEKSASNFTRGEKVIATLLTAIALGIQIYVVTGGLTR